VGFDGAPRPLGLDDHGREMLEWIDGVDGRMVTPTQASLRSAIALIRRLHDASASFVPPRGAVWNTQPFMVDRSGDDPDIIGHHDLATYNLIYRDSVAVAVIDWDFAGPSSRLWDFANAAWTFTPMYPDELLIRLGYDPEHRAQRFQVICDTYGVDDRQRLLELIGLRLRSTHDPSHEYVRFFDAHVDSWVREFDGRLDATTSRRGESTNVVSYRPQTRRPSGRATPDGRETGSMRLHPGEPEAVGWRVVTVPEVVRRLREASPGVTGRPRVVGIDGRGGAGKTTLAERLCRMVPGSAVVHTDDVAWHHAYFDWGVLLIENVLRPLHRGAAVEFRPEAWVARDRPGSITVPGDAGFVWVEGTGVIRQELAPWLDASLWLQGDLDEQERLLVARDGDSSEQRQHVSDWLKEELPFLLRERPWARATMIVQGPSAIAHDPDNEMVVAPPTGR